MKKFLLIACSLLISLAIAEIMLRVAGISYPVFGIIDPDRGFAMPQNVEGWQTNEGRAYVKINSDSLRDEEHTLKKPDDTLRIAILGDSNTAAIQVPVEQTFWKVLESNLGKCEAMGGRKVEVINFGNSGYGQAQELLTLRHHVWKYDPDIILLAFVTGNDITDDLEALRKNPTVPYFEIKNGKLSLDDSFRTPVFNFKLSIGYGQIFRLLYKLRIFQLIRQVRRVVLTWEIQSSGNEASPLERGNLPAELRDGLDHAIYTPPPNADWAKAWEVTEALLLTMAAEISEKGADFWIVTLSNGIQVNPDISVRQAFMKYKGISNLHYPNLRIQQLAEKNDISVVNAVGPLAEYSQRENVYLHGFVHSVGKGNLGRGHLNRAGHRETGMEIVTRMCKTPSKALLSR